MPNRLLLFLALWLLSLPSFCLGQTPQIISFPKPDDVNMGAAPFAVNATTTAPGLTVTLTSTSPTFCTVAGTTVTLVAVGKCSITATQAGGVSGGVTYSAAAPVSQSFQVNSQFPGVDAVFGIGSLITGNRTNYKVNSTANVLEGTQIGRASPQLLAGVSFQLPVPAANHWHSNCPNQWTDSCRPWHAFVSLKFSTDSTQTILGYTFGVTYRITKYLDLLLGYTLTPFQEPSPGFQRAAVRAVALNPTLYPTFNAAALNNNIAGAFDGFPLQIQKACTTGAQCSTNTTGTVGVNLYAGDPLESRYYGGLMIGISVPVSLNSIFGMPKKTQ